MDSVVQAMDVEDSQNPGNQPGTTIGAVGPLFSAQQNSSAAARTTRNVGAKPTRTFVWLGPNVSDVDFSSLNEKKIKFERNMNAVAMVALLKREFPAITARISYYKSRSSGNHALYHVGDALSGEEIVHNYRSCTTRVFVADRQAVRAVPPVPVVPPLPVVPPVPAAVVNTTMTSNTSAGHSTDKAPEECIEVGVIAPGYSDDGLYHPGLLHSSRLQIVDTALKGAKSSGLPYVSMTFECLCHHINSGPRIALVILTNHAKHLTVGESEMLSVLSELYCNERMAYDPDPLVWIQSRDSVEGMEAIQTIGGQTLGYPQLVICTPSLRGVKAPLVVEKFPDNFMSVDFVEAMAKAKEAVQVVQINRVMTQINRQMAQNL